MCYVAYSHALMGHHLEYVHFWWEEGAVSGMLRASRAVCCRFSSWQRDPFFEKRRVCTDINRRRGQSTFDSVPSRQLCSKEAFRVSVSKTRANGLERVQQLRIASDRLLRYRLPTPSIMFQNDATTGRSVCRC